MNINKTGLLNFALPHTLHGTPNNNIGVGLWALLSNPAITADLSFVLANTFGLFAAIFALATLGTHSSRRTLLYGINVILMVAMIWTQHYYAAWLVLWVVLHSCAHQRWPFITYEGLNIRSSAFVDVCVHLVMHAIVHDAITSMGVSKITEIASGFILAGCMLNCVVAISCPVNDPTFVATSRFQALSSGGWLGFLIISHCSNQPQSPLFEAYLWMFWLAGALNWLLFKKSTYFLRKLFTLNYLDTFFAIPVWIYIANTIVLQK